MKLPDKNRIVSVVVLLVSFASFALIVSAQIELRGFLREAAEVGMAVEISADDLQRSLRILAAMFVGAIALWSRAGAKIAIISSLLIFVFLEVVDLLSSNGEFDIAEPEIHFTAALLIFLAIIFLIRKGNHIVVSMIAFIYIIIEFLFWHLSTRRLKASTGVEYLSPNTPLENTFNGANWWHVCILVLSISLLIGEIIIYVRHLRSCRPGR